MSRRPAFSFRRNLSALTALILGAGTLAVFAAAPASAASRDFTPVFSTNTTGDVLVRGNSLESCRAGDFKSGSTTTTCGGVQTGVQSGTNNSFFMSYVDVDSDSSTFDSSTATVTIPSGASVLYAALVWGGDTGAGSLSGDTSLTGVAAPNANLKNQAAFKAPGATSYTTLTATATDTATTSISNYQSFKDVTSIVAAAGSGVYSVGNVQAGTGGNGYAGWALAVAYRDTTQPVRNLVIYNGYNFVTGTTTVPVTLAGFQTPPTGAVNTKLGIVAYEGDRGTTGDTVSITNTAGTASSVSNSLNPANDVFNSTITDLNTAVTDRNPNYKNTMGIDIDRFDVSAALSNSQTSTTITFATSGDGYFPGLFTFATDLYSPELTATKTVTDTTSGTGTVSRNDVLTYSTAVTNSGTDASAATVLTDAVPAGTTYVPGSLTIGGAGVTDATGDDAGNVSSGAVTARLGAGATASAGGALAVSASVTVTFQVTVNSADTDGTVLTGAAASVAYNGATTGLTIAPASSNTVTSTVIAPPTVTSSATLPDGEVGAAYAATLTNSDGTGPFTWSVTSGSLPAGLTLAPSTGVLSGTPTTAGAANFTVQVSDTNSRTGTKATSITVVAAPTVTSSATLAAGEVGAAYADTLTNSGGTGPFTWSVSSGSLPAGVTLDTSSGALTGTPTTPGTSNFTVLVTDAKSVTATKATSITVVAGPALTYSAPGNGDVGVAYSTTLSVTGGTGPSTWSVSSGSLPAGVTLNSSTGVVSGTPTATGTSTFTVHVIDSRGQSDTRANTTITVVALPSLSFAAPTSGVVGVSYSDQLTVTGGTAPFTWSVNSGSLPAGITLDPSTGLLAGTPSVAGTYSFVVGVSDSYSQTATEAVTLVIKSVGVVGLVSSAPTVGMGGVVTLTATVSPSSPTGTVQFTDVPSSGPNAGTTVVLGSGTVGSGGVVSLTGVVLGSFGAHTFGAAYSGDSTHTSATSSAAVTEVAAAAGQILIEEFRLSGPGGAADQYVQLTDAVNIAIPLAGFTITGTAGSVTLANSAPTLLPGHNYLVVGSSFSLTAATVTPDLTTSTLLGTGGLKVIAPDTAQTVTDKVGSADGYFLGTALPAFTGTPTNQYAWTRQIGLTAVQNTSNSRADFNLVSTTGGLVGGVQSVLGSPAPAGSADPVRVALSNSSTGTPSSLLDPHYSAAQAPNRVTQSSIGSLITRRTITNRTGAVITSMYLRITSLSQTNGRTQPGTGASGGVNLKLAGVTGSGPVAIYSSSPVTVHTLAPTSPVGVSGGGLNSTLLVPLPARGLYPGESVSVAITFVATGSGTFWFNYDTDVVTVEAPG